MEKPEIKTLTDWLAYEMARILVDTMAYKAGLGPKPLPPGKPPEGLVVDIDLLGKA